MLMPSMCLWKSKGNFTVLVFSFPIYVVPGLQTQILGLLLLQTELLVSVSPGIKFFFLSSLRSFR